MQFSKNKHAKWKDSQDMYTRVHKCLQAHLEILSPIYIQAISLRLMRNGWWLRSPFYFYFFMNSSALICKLVKTSMQSGNFHSAICFLVIFHLS